MNRIRRALAIAALVAAPGLLGAGAAAAGTSGTTPPAATPAGGKWSGQAAIDKLGDRLPAVAAANGLSATKLKKHLATDPSLAVDATDRLLYIDATPTPQQLATVNATPFDPSIPTADAFTLHSKPGANRTIFLDFDGHTLSGTAWNSSTGGTCYAEPYDSDSTPGTFSSAELGAVIDVWKRVAEDYAAFDVDVTTADPGYDAINRSSSSDTVFGTRLIITKSVSPCPNGKTLYSSICGGGCGGIAYVGVFDNTGSGHDTYQPAIVFQNGVSSYSKYVAEAASHEVGHNIGLNHDGTSSAGYYSGQGDWAPIMGVGYYEAISQWSKGEYSGANNTEDDFVTAGNNGLPLRTDDHGDTTATATALAGNPATVDGVISTRTDVDAFTVVAPDGPATFTASPTPVSPNLDIEIEVFDSNGVSLGSNDPTSGSSNGDVSTGMGATLTLELTAGTYTVLIDGVGKGDPAVDGYSDYASVGNYRLDVTVTGPEGRAPTAVAAANPMRGVAPLPVTFTGSGSTDPELGALTYSWNFGDGSALSTLADPTHTFTTAGNYTVTLTVTDDMNLTSSTTLVINVTAPVRTIDLNSLNVAGVRNPSTGRSNITGTVTVKDNSNLNVGGTAVTATWTVGTKVASSKTVNTNSSGVATFSLTNQRLNRGVVVKLCVTRIALGSTIVDAALFAPSTFPVCSSWTVA